MSLAPDRLDDLAIELDEELKRLGSLTHSNIEAHFDLPRARVDEVVRHHRLTLSYPTRALITKPVGDGEWLYTISEVPAEIARWVGWMLDHIEARSETTEVVAEIAVNLTDGRTAEGKRARVMLRHTHRIVEDVSDIHAVPAGDTK